MSIDARAQLAQESIRKILEILKVNQVYYVDDVLEKEPNIVTINGWVAEAYSKSPEDTQNLIPEIPLEVPSEVFSQSVQRFWTSARPEQQQSILKGLARILGNSLNQDFVVVNGVKDLFPNTLRFESLSPTAWVAQRDSLLRGVGPDSKVLCLFDHNLELADGFTSSGSKSGAGLIQEAVARVNGKSIICGLFTHTISSLDAEMPAWRSIAKDNSLRLDQFLPLAKLRYTGGNPLEFADGIKKTALNLYCENMKINAIEVLESAHEFSKEELMTIDVYDFDSAILRSSFKEGEWEADTLIRIFYIFQKDQMRQAMLNAEKASAFNESVSIARAISSVNTALEDKSEHSWAAKTRRIELFEEKSLKHAPLQLGDIFHLEKDGDGYKDFVLLAQPCDLMVRSNNLPRIDGFVVPLIPIVAKKTFNKAQEEKASYWRKHTSLPYFLSNPNEVAILGFDSTVWIRREILDLAVLDSDGVCQLDLNKPIDVLPPQLTYGWQQHLSQIIKKFKDYREVLDQIEKSLGVLQPDTLRQQIWQMLMPRTTLLDSWFASSLYANGIFNFHLKRISHYRHTKANMLLNEFTHYLSRVAEDHDFSRWFSNSNRSTIQSRWKLV